jgi:hypothetical protein
MTDTQSELEAEVGRLRARVAQLEAELFDVQDWANKTVGAAQERAYWLDRWHIDLNALMERPGADQFRAAVRQIRSVFRLIRRLRRRLSSRS